MPGLVPGIHVFLSHGTQKDVDGRVKPGHDEKEPSGLGNSAAALALTVGGRFNGAKGHSS